MAETERRVLEDSEPHAESSSDSTVVPSGHQVEMFRMPESLDPSVSSLGDSVCIVGLGCGSDEPVEELEGILRQLGPQLWDAQRPAMVA